LKNKLYKIPLFDLNFDKEEEKAVIETLRSRWISTGPKVQKFEKIFSKLLDVKFSVALSSCTTSLHLAVKILELKEGDEVICPSLTFVATSNAIKYEKATPVFCDVVSYENLNIDPDKIESLITGKTKAIIVMHYAGFPCEMDKIMSIAEKYNLKVIEDACHGPLSEYKGKKVGTIGDIGCFSFFSNKNISVGEGGMLVTNNRKYSEKAKLLRSHGMTTLSYERAGGHSTFYDVVELGYNYRMDDIRASLGIVQLKKLKQDLRKRAELRKYYIQKLSDVPGIIIPFKDFTKNVSNYIFPIVLTNSTKQKRDFIRNELLRKGIQTSIHYPPVHKFKIYDEGNLELPVTDYVSENEITLPLFGTLSYDKIDYIAEKFRKSLKINY